MFVFFVCKFQYGAKSEHHHADQSDTKRNLAIMPVCNKPDEVYGAEEYAANSPYEPAGKHRNEPPQVANNRHYPTQYHDDQAQRSHRITSNLHCFQIIKTKGCYVRNARMSNGFAQT